ncbi:FecCD family ABC transporter permease [Methanomassiliicoccus luminyensis]|jgi:iron complex transport system permease protein|uniref:FecCD family ABC transporter permease n=1 Tax=Methanomassiliicoccus luminyensis TaxID=1080712 RepID=UPI00036ECD98|nr:iron ABC transporter permease [Methanomassiliicoccus luminyensis]
MSSEGVFGGWGRRSASGEGAIRTVRGVKHAKAKLLVILLMGSVSLGILVIMSLTFGTIQISFLDALSSTTSLILKFGNPAPGNLNELVIYHLRMPRALAVIAVGAGLSAAGAVMQALIRNPLVDPYITGVSSGASFAVTLAMLGGVFLGGAFSYFTIPISAIIGAIGAFFLTMVLAEGAGGKAMSYVLSGVIIGIGLSAGTTLLMTFNAENVHMTLFWMFGSFAGIDWTDALFISIPIAICLLILLFFARDLNTVLLGDEQAQQLGLNTRRLKLAMVILVSVLTAMCVAFCGVIGFVGLIVPHVARIIIGGDHRLLLPASMMIGANVLLVADIACKTLMSPAELPIGAIIAVIGVPFFAYLMLREGKRYAM